MCKPAWTKPGRLPGKDNNGQTAYGHIGDWEKTDLPAMADRIAAFSRGDFFEKDAVSILQPLNAASRPDLNHR